MDELIAAYEEKIASLETTISIQDQMINSLADFLKDTASKLYPIIADSVKNSAALSVKIQKLKDQSIEISDQDASDLDITPDNEEDDFVVADDNEEDDFVVADDNEEDDFVVADDNEEDDFVVADDNEEDDFVVPE